MTTAGEPGDLRAQKRALRSSARRAAAKLDAAERERRSRTLQARLLNLPELHAARAVALYAPLRDEVQLDWLATELRGRGCRLAYPRLEADDLHFHWVGEAFALRAGSRGVLEPDLFAPLAPLEAIDAMLVPGLLFDRRGRRLGRGGGHYDRLLARVPARTATFGVCMAESLVSSLPCEPHDVPLRCVVTDQETLRIV